MNDVLADVPFSVRIVRRADGTCIVHTTGEADMHAAPELDRELRTCEDESLRRVVIDLTEATLLDSTALGVLVSAHGRLGKRGVPLKLACTDRLILRLLSITGLDRVLEVYATSAEAMNGGIPIKRVKGGAARDVVHGEPGAASES